MIEVRIARITDCDGILAVVHSMAVERGRAPGESNSVLAAVRDCIESPHHGIWVAAGADQILGYIAVHWIPFPIVHGKEGYISDLFVTADHRGGGLGRRLLIAVEDRAREIGCVRLMLNNRTTDESYERSFYHKAGFRVRGDIANFVKPLQ